MSLFDKHKQAKFLNSDAFNSMLSTKIAEHNKAKDEETEKLIAEKDKDLKTKDEELKLANEKLELAELNKNKTKIVTDDEGKKYTLNIHQEKED